MDLQVEYDNRARVPENPAIIAGWQRAPLLKLIKDCVRGGQQCDVTGKPRP